MYFYGVIPVNVLRENVIPATGQESPSRRDWVGMKFLKNLTVCASCASLVLLVQSCGDDTTLSPIGNSQIETPFSSSSLHSGLDPESMSSAVILSGDSHEESSSSNTLTSSAIQSSSSSTALSEVYDSASSTSSPTSSFAESSSSKDVEPVETSSSSSRHSGLDPESSSSEQVSSSSRHSGPEPESSSSALPIKIDFFNGADISEVQE
jgi:hypothetical protein